MLLTLEEITHSFLLADRRFSSFIPFNSLADSFTFISREGSELWSMDNSWRLSGMAFIPRHPSSSDLEKMRENSKYKIKLQEENQRLHTLHNKLRTEKIKGFLIALGAFF